MDHDPMANTYKCQSCNNPLWSHDEIEDKRCNRCTDKLIDHANERAEWHHYHD